ncbi:MAG: putative DEAD-box family RNA-dependent helicase, partial [Streblomastix strix]
MYILNIQICYLDVQDIKYVINYDVPKCIEDYVHRIGRTARGTSQGTSMTFMTDDDMRLARDIVRVLEEAHQPVPDELRRGMYQNRGTGRGRGRGWGQGGGRGSAYGSGANTSFVGGSNFNSSISSNSGGYDRNYPGSYNQSTSTTSSSSSSSTTSYSQSSSSGIKSINDLKSSIKPYVNDYYSADWGDPKQGSAWSMEKAEGGMGANQTTIWNWIWILIMTMNDLGLTSDYDAMNETWNKKKKKKIGVIINNRGRETIKDPIPDLTADIIEISTEVIRRMILKKEIKIKIKEGIIKAEMIFGVKKEEGNTVTVTVEVTVVIIITITINVGIQKEDNQKNKKKKI